MRRLNRLLLTALLAALLAACGGAQPAALVGQAQPVKAQPLKARMQPAQPLKADMAPAP